MERTTVLRRVGTGLAVAAFVSGGVLVTQSYRESRAARSGSSVSFDAVSDTGRKVGEYAFSQVVDATPVTWDRCVPIRVVFARSAVDAGIVVEARTALADINAEGAFMLVDAGVVDHEPTENWNNDRAAFDADVIVAVSSDAATDLLDGAAATTTNRYEFSSGAAVFTDAAVVVDEQFLGDYRSGMGPRSVGALLTHELLHVVGLGHVDDPTSVITPRVSDGAGVIGPGDRAGLAALMAAAPCTPPPHLPAP